MDHGIHRCICLIGTNHNGYVFFSFSFLMLTAHMHGLSHCTWTDDHHPLVPVNTRINHHCILLIDTNHNGYICFSFSFITLTAHACMDNNDPSQPYLSQKHQPHPQVFQCHLQRQPSQLSPNRPNPNHLNSNTSASHLNASPSPSCDQSSSRLNAMPMPAMPAVPQLPAPPAGTSMPMSASAIQASASHSCQCQPHPQPSQYQLFKHCT